MFSGATTTVSSKFIYVGFFFCHILSIFKLNVEHKAIFFLHQTIVVFVAQI